MGRIAVFFVISGGFLPSIARASEPVAPAGGIALIYHVDPGVEGCASEEALKDAIAARLGYVPWAPPIRRQMRARIHGRNGALSAVIVLEDASGETLGRRELGPFASCADLVTEMTLAMGIAIDPLSAGTPPKATGGAAKAAPQDERPLTAKAAAPEPTKWQLGASTVVSLFAAPSTAVGVRLFGALRLRAFSAGIEGRADAPASMDVSGGKISTALLLASLFGCVHLDPGAGCLLINGGGIRASGDGLSNEQKSTSPFASVGGRALADLALTDRFALRGQIDLTAVLTRVELVDSRTAQPFWTTPEVAISLGFGAVFTLE